MKKLLLFIMFIIGTFSYSACEYVTGMSEDPLAIAVYNEIKAVGYENNIYCDQTGKMMLYYLKGRNDLQVGIYFNVESSENYIDRSKYFNKINKVSKKIAKDYKGKPITIRSFYISQKGVYAITVTKLDEKGKIISYGNEKMRDTVHFPENASSGYRYTSDIIW